MKTFRNLFLLTLLVAASLWSGMLVADTPGNDFQLAAPSDCTPTTALDIPLDDGRIATACNAFCQDDADCRSACPNDPGVYCSDYLCVGSGGGGGGGGGGTCNAFCQDDADCASACPHVSAYCSGYVCQTY